jgi:hypothetical protein
MTNQKSLILKAEYDLNSTVGAILNDITNETKKYPNFEFKHGLKLLVKNDKALIRVVLISK